MSSSCGKNEHDWVVDDSSGFTVCVKCADLKDTSINQLTNEQEPNYQQNASTNRNVNNYSKRNGNNLNSNAPKANANFEDRLNILCGSMNCPSLENSCRALYTLVLKSWPSITKYVADQVVAALIYITSRKENKGWSLTELADKLGIPPHKGKLAYYNIGVLASKIQTKTGTTVDACPTKGVINRGIPIFKELFQDYNEEECEELINVTKKVIEFGRYSGLFEGKNLPGCYIACLYTAVCHTISVEFLRSRHKQGTNTLSSPNGGSNLGFGNCGLVYHSRTKAKKKDMANEIVKTRVKPFLERMVTEFSAPKGATELRIKELERYWMSKSNTSEKYKDIVTHQNWFQLVPNVIDDCFKYCKLDDYETKSPGKQTATKTITTNTTTTTTTTTTSGNGETTTTTTTATPTTPGNGKTTNGKFKEPNYNFEGISFDAKKGPLINIYTNTNTIDELDTSNFIQTDQTPKKSKKLRVSKPREDKKRSRVDFEKSILQSPEPPCPTSINSIYKDNVEKLRLITIKKKLVENGELVATSITNEDLKHCKLFKSYNVPKNKAIDEEFEKLLILKIPDYQILNGSVTLESIKVGKDVAKAKLKNDDLEREELDDDDLSENELQVYLRSDGQKRHFQAIQNYMEEQEQNAAYVEVTQKDLFGSPH